MNCHMSACEGKADVFRFNFGSLSLKCPLFSKADAFTTAKLQFSGSAFGHKRAFARGIQISLEQTFDTTRRASLRVKFVTFNLVGVYSKSIIIFPRACPSSEYRIAAETSLNR